MSVFRSAKENKKIAYEAQIKQLQDSLAWCREVIPKLINEAAEEGKYSITIPINDRIYTMICYCKDELIQELKENGYDAHGGTQYLTGKPEFYIHW